MIITDWPVYRAGMIALWLSKLERINEQLKDEKLSPGMREEMEILRQCLVDDILHYESQQQQEGH